MFKKKLKWLMVPAIAAVAFIGFSSFVDDGESSRTDCVKSNVKGDYCSNPYSGGIKYNCKNHTGGTECN